MIRHLVIALALLTFAGGILVTSILRATAPSYAFPTPANQLLIEQRGGEVNYFLAYPGILPDHFLWPLKSVRDRVWLFLTPDSFAKSQLLLLLADKRIGAAQAVLKNGKPELAVPAAQKAEMYLEQAVLYEEKARRDKQDTGQYLEKLALSILKHREVLENMYLLAPEEARPLIARTIDYPKLLFDRVTTSLREVRRPVPRSHFEE